MFPFWDLVIAPIFDAVGARRIVEIGALRGENTVQMLRALGPDAELHVIDPVPAFDPAEHEREFPGQYIFHRDLSVNVLEDLPPMDVALIDGDHNWYTVYNECRMLAAVARKAGQPMPVMILHDVLWPYGRRDLYYDPSNIPAEHRQPYERKGIAMKRSRLLDKGGLNPSLANAVEEGGPHNGVMTGLEDFIAEYDKPLRHLLLPIYFGLSVVVEEERLANEPRLQALFERLEDRDGRLDLMELAETTRLQAMVMQHNVFYQRDQQLERAATRYLDLLRAALLDEHYLENELRIRHLASCIENGQAVIPQKLADPVRARQQWQEMWQARVSGTHDMDAASPVPAYFPATTMGRARLDDLRRCLDAVRTESVPGDLVECATGRGGGAIFLRGYLHAWERGAPTVWVADRFRSSPDELSDPGGGALPGGGEGFPDFQPDLNNVRDLFDRFGLLNQRVRFLQGPYRETLPGAAELEKVALLRIGHGAGAEAGDILDELYDRISVGGFVIVDDHRDKACRKAVREFRERRGIEDPVERVDWSTVRWRKSTEAPPEGTDAAPRTAAAQKIGPPLAPDTPAKPKDLTVVVVFHNMRREAERTLHSLTRAYQRGIDDLDYEVIVVDNGSSPEQRLDEAFVTSFGPEFRFIDMGPDAPPTPVTALNTGVAAGAGRAFALMIDGAHVLTPGVLRFGMAGLKTYEPAIVMTQQWYVGPGQQPTATANGYDQGFEDELFERITWPVDGYRLFDIGHFISERDWFDGMWESNCLFAPRRQLRQIGAFDEGFASPGGGYANLDLYERLGSSPDVNVVTILGEGSFHQVHGGTTTNVNVADERNQGLASYAGDYVALRGRPFNGPGRTLHYIGQMRPEAMRTKGRRRVAGEFWIKRGNADEQGLPSTPSPIPDELKHQFTEAVWESLLWRNASWLGVPTDRLPTDLFVYAEILYQVKPDWVVELGPGSGGRGLFLAAVLNQLGKGKVLSVGPAPDIEAKHPRLQRLRAGTLRDKTIATVHETVGQPPNAVVIHGGRHSVLRTTKEFDAYSDLVPVGSYAIIEDTIVNGHPVWPTFGPGPGEAANRIVNRRAAFGPDVDLEKYGITFNPGGFLKRFR